MNRFTEQIIDYSEGNLSAKDRVRFESELKSNNELRDEYELFRLVDDVMQAKFDLDEILSDEDMASIDAESQLLVAEFKKQPSKYIDINSFVENSLLSDEEMAIQSEIDQIIKEIKDKNIDVVTQGWVSEWNTDKVGRASFQHKEIADFVINSLSNSYESSTDHKASIWWYKSTLFRVVSFSAAAVLAIVLVVRSMFIPTSSEELFVSYYKPYQAVTSVTRSNDDGINNIYNQAIVNYRNGNFQQAAIGFDLVMQRDTFKVAPRFFAGLSQIELGNYAKAIELLESIDANSTDFKAETNWYLGLTYLKVDQKEKAISYFKVLANTSGYYQEPASALVEELTD